MPLARRLRILLLAIAIAPSACAPRARPILLLVSLDGWRADYGPTARTPNLQAMAARGVRAEALIPAFPAKTFPNHYTIVTGLYPEHHGIVANVMDDPAIGERFTMSAPTALDPRWWGGEPLWNTANRQGLRTASMFWPGSEVPIGGMRPTYWLPYDDDVPDDARVKQVLDWLALPEPQRPSFVTLYFSDVDTAGHRYGPSSPQVSDAIARLDALLGSVVAGINSLGLTGRTTIAVVSDHGMAQLDPSHMIYLDDYLDLSTVSIVEWSPVLGLRPRGGDADAVYHALAGRHPALHVYRREEMPQRYHYRSHRRIPPIVGIADEGWTITSHAQLEHDREQNVPMGGTHGFDPASPSMQALFVAAGPALRRSVVVPAFENIHLYDFFCRVLGIAAAANDGDAAVTRDLFER